MDETPRIEVEPQIPVATEFATVDHVRSVIMDLDRGSFRNPALLIERMLWNPRLRAAMETRLNGLLAAKVRFEELRNTPAAKRAAREFGADWPSMAPGPERRQNRKWSIMLGVALAQRVLDDASSSGRHLLKVRPYWPGFMYWHDTERKYQIQTRDNGIVSATSPSLTVPPLPSVSAWMIAEPNGPNSYREAHVHAAWRPWLGHEWGMRDQARKSEKDGVGTIKAYIPDGDDEKNKAQVKKFTAGVQGMGSGAVVPCVRRPEADGGGFDIEPFEFNGSGSDAIDRTITTCAIALAILFLGHNLTTEIKSGGSYAAAGVADYIRDDIKNADAVGEWAFYGPHLARAYCLLNYGDPDLAPIAIYETDSTAINKTIAEMYQHLAQAISTLKQCAPNVDIDVLCQRFNLPMKLVNKTQVATPPASEGDKPDGAPAAEQPSTAPIPTAPDTAAQGAAATSATLALTPSDLASIVRVDEGRKSVGLEPVGGDDGQLYIREHTARLAAKIGAPPPTTETPTAPPSKEAA